MKIGKPFAAFYFLFLLSLPSFAQNKQWGQVIINLPEGWGTNMKAGNTIYSNYNIQGSEPFSITLFKPEPLTGNTDSLFSEAWRKYLATELPGTVSPRPKRWSTDIGIPLFTGAKEITDKTNPAFYLFGVYPLSGTYQAFLIHTTSAKVYREVQSEWQERLLGILLPAAKK